VVLVRAQHAEDVVTLARRLVGGEAGEQASDLHDDLGAVIPEEGEVTGDLEVLPHVVRDRKVDVPLELRVIGQPAPGPGIQVEPLRLLPTVASALPREQRSSVALFACRPPRLGQSTVPVLQERAGEDREPVVEQREDEQLIPKHVSPVRLAVQTAGRNPHVEVDGVRGQGLEQMEHVQPQQEL